MSVDAFTVDGKITLDTEDFNTEITNVTSALEKLSTAFKPLDTASFVESFQGIKGEFNNLKVIAEEINSMFRNIIDIPKIIEDMEKVRAELESVKNYVSTIKTETTAVSNDMVKCAEASMSWSEALATVSPNFQGMISSLEMMNAREQERLGELRNVGSELVKEGSQIKKNTTYYEQELQVAKQFKNAQEGLISGYVEQGQAIERANALEKQRLSTLQQEMKLATQLGNAYLKNSREQNRQLTYEREMLMVEEQFASVIGDEIVSKFQFNNILQESAMLEKEILSLMGDQTAMTGEEIAEETKKLNTLRQELDLEREILATEKQQTVEESKQTKERMAGASASAKGNKLDKMGYLPSRITSMAVTMLGYQEIMDVWNKTTSNVNAKTQFNTYADMLKTDNRYLKQTKQSTADVTKGINELNKSLFDTYKGGESLQRQYQKVDMKMVGANALDTAFKYGVQADALGDLTEVMAIYSSEFVRQGRSQEDSILAVNDALDGEFRRLKEVNIGKEELEAHGYEEGNQLSLIKAMREIASERGYDVTAKKITTLSEAINVAELELAFLLSDLFEMAEPSLIYALGKLVELFRWLGDGVKQVKDYLKGLPQPTKDFLKAFGGNLMLSAIGVWIGSKIIGAVRNMSLFGGAWEKLMGKLGRTKGMDKATESMGKMGQTTGGTVGTGGGNWKDGIKNWGTNLARNIGKMAEVFIEVAVAFAMAWALMKEAILLIEDLGNDFEKHKDGFNKGWTFLKDYGVWLLAIGGAMAILLQYTDKLPQVDWKSQAKAVGKLALGLAEAMLLIGEAIALLIVPMGAIALLGWMYGQLDPIAIQKGTEVIGMYSDALDYIASNDNIGGFIIALTIASAVLGFTADTVGVAFAIGIASSLLLIAEAIVMLIAPLKAVELLGGMANSIDEDALKSGMDAIGVVGRVLKELEPVVRDLLLVDFEVFGIGLVEKGNQIVNGKDGLKSLTEDILPSLVTFVGDIDGLTLPKNLDISSKITAITQMATQLVPMFNAMQKLNNAMGIGGVMGKASTGIGGIIDSYMGTGLKAQLDKMYNDVKDVMDFATKIGNLNGGGSTNTTAVQQTANVISQLKTKLNQLTTAISDSAPKIQTASKTMGSSITTGFKEGTANFKGTVVSVLANGISEVQSRYPTWKSGGKASADKLAEGFKTISNSFKSVISTEMGYALEELDNYKDDFYDKGKALGSELTRGYEDGADIHSPGLIARTTARELRYTMEALTVGEQMMYRGGVALGQALTNGYNTGGNLRTNVDVLASKGVSNEQLQANAKNVQVNAKKNQQVPQSLNPTINIDMSNSTVIGVQDLDEKIRSAVEKAIITINSPNGAIGY